MTSQRKTGIPSDPASRHELIVRKYGELTELLDSFGYELTVDDTDLDVSVEDGHFLFTLDTVVRTD